MRNNVKNILYGTLLIAITVIATTLVTSQIYSVNEVVCNCEEQLETYKQSLIDVGIPTNPDIYSIILDMKGFSTKDGEALTLTINYDWVADVPISHSSFKAWFGLFDETTGEYTNVMIENPKVMESGILTGYIGDANLLIYERDNLDSSTIIFVEVYDNNTGEQYETLKFASTPYYVTIEEVEEVEKSYKDLTVEDLIEIGKMLLPLLI